MRKYLLIITLLLSLGSLVSCTKNNPAISGSNLSDNKTQNTSNTQRVKPLSSLLEEQKKKDAEVANAKLSDCDASSVKQTAKDSLKFQNIAADHADVYVTTAPERCKVRAVIRDNLQCSELTDTKLIEKCEYVKQAVKEVKEFEEKRTAYEKLFGSIDSPTSKQIPAVLSDWW